MAAPEDDQQHLLNGDTKTTGTTHLDITKHAPLPRKELWLIWIVHASQGFQTTMLFPMLIFMVQKYGIPTQETGKFAGLLASLFPLAQFCTSFMWGKISDCTGRKMWLVFSNVVAAVSSVFLGLCTTYLAACVVRFVAGLLNGSVTLTKSILGEICNGTNQAKGFAVLNLAWGIGSIMGPIFAGILAQPCIQYRFNQCPPMFYKYPFLLPCICAFLLSSSSAIASLKLTETNPQLQKPIAIDRDSAEMLPLCSKVGEDFPGHALCNQEENKIKARKASKYELSINAIEMHDFKQEQFVRASNGKRESPPLLKDPNVLLTTLCYSMTGLVFIITDELFPLFGAALESTGGLGLGSSVLGMILGAGGVVLFMYTMFLYPKVAERVGPLRCFRLGLLTSVPICIMFPVTSLLPRISILRSSFLTMVVASKNMAGCNAFTSVLILVSNSASQANMGAVTGLSHGFCSLFRAVGPALGGLMWNLSVKKAFPFHQFMAWLAIASLILFTYMLSLLLPHTLDKPKIETEVETMCAEC